MPCAGQGLATNVAPAALQLQAKKAPGMGPGLRVPRSLPSGPLTAKEEGKLSAFLYFLSIQPQHKFTGGLLQFCC